MSPVSSTLSSWNGRNDIPFLFVDPNGVEDRMRVIAPIDASYLHGRYTKTIGDCRISNQDFRENVDIIIEREGSIHALLRSMYAHGASARDIAIFADCLYRKDVGVAQPLSRIAIDDVAEGYEDVRFSDLPGSAIGVGRDVIVFGDGVDDDVVDTCIIAQFAYDPVKTTFPDGKMRYFPIGRRALSALVSSLRAVDAKAGDRIAVAGPMYDNAIPESMRASIEVRIHGAVDVSTIRPAMATYGQLATTLCPVAMSTNATIAVVRQSTGETIVEVPVMVDMVIPTFVASTSRYGLRMPTYDDVERSFDTYPGQGGDFLFILAHDADRVRSFTSLSMPEQVLELANIFRRDIRNLVEVTTFDSAAERHLTGETVYIYFPLALYALSTWTIDNDTSFAIIEGVLDRIGVEDMLFERMRPGIWRLRMLSAAHGENEMMLHIADD